MKNIKIFVLFNILGMLLHAQTGEISGRVFNAKQEPLWGSNVYLTGTIYGASTDSAGYFNITGIYLITGLMRMNANRAPNIVESFGKFLRCV